MVLAYLWSLPFWAWILIFIPFIIIGAIIGFFFARKYMEKYIEANPPITEKMVRTLFQHTGRTPSEKQIRQTMADIKAQSGQGNKK